MPGSPTTWAEAKRPAAAVSSCAVSAARSASRPTGSAPGDGTSARGDGVGAAWGADAGADRVRSISGDWRSTADSSALSRGPGSMPSSSASVVRTVRSASRASAWRPARARARAWVAHSPSRSGCRAVADSVVASTPAWSPTASRASNRASSAAARSCSSDDALGLDVGVVGRSAYGSPAHVASAASRRSTAATTTDSRVGQPGPGPVSNCDASGGQHATGRAYLLGERVRVDRRGRHPEDVAVVGGLDDRGGAADRPLGLEHAAQPGEVRVQRALGGARRLAAPDQVGQRVGRHRPAGGQRQGGDHRARLARAEVDVRPAVVQDAAATQDADPHAHTVIVSGGPAR